ncbi:hypothetical protein ACMFMF_010150 [Clarireedia jacksonii]
MNLRSRKPKHETLRFDNPVQATAPPPSEESEVTEWELQPPEPQTAETSEEDEVTEWESQPFEKQVVEPVNRETDEDSRREISIGDTIMPPLLALFLLFVAWRCMRIPTYEAQISGSEVVDSMKDVANVTFDLLENANQLIYVENVLSHSNNLLSELPGFAWMSTLPQKQELGKEYRLIANNSEKLLFHVMAYRETIDQLSIGVEENLKVLSDNLVMATTFKRLDSVDSMAKLFMYFDDGIYRVRALTLEGIQLCTDVKLGLGKIHEYSRKAEGISNRRGNAARFVDWIAGGPSRSDIRTQISVDQQLQRVLTLYETTNSLFAKVEYRTHLWQANTKAIPNHLERLHGDNDTHFTSAEIREWIQIRQDLMALIPMSGNLTRQKAIKGGAPWASRS